MRGIGLVVASSTNKEVPGIKYFVESLILNVTSSSGVEPVLKTPLHADILVGGSRGEEQDGDALHRRNFHPGFIKFSSSYMSPLQEFDGDAFYRRNFHPGFVRFSSLCLFAMSSKI